MSFGQESLVPCPHGCGQQLVYVDFRVGPPPIPPPPGGYATLNRYLGDESQIHECPKCEGEL